MLQQYMGTVFLNNYREFDMENRIANIVFALTLLSAIYVTIVTL